MTGLSLNRLIFSKLNGNEEITQMLGQTDDIQKIYPIVAERDTNFPYLVFKREKIEPYTAKGITVGDLVTFSIIVCSTSNLESINIAEKVREVLEYSSMNLSNLKLIEAQEDYSFGEGANDGYFYEKLIFSANIIKK